MSESDHEWEAVLRRLLEGDRLALARLARLVNGFLTRWNAYDFRDEWDDLAQEVVTAAALALRSGRLREPGAALGFLYRTARFKYVDRLRAQLRLRDREGLACEPPPGLAEVEREDLRRALSRISDKARCALVAVYVDGFTYQEAARVTGIPLGTLKRCLRDGLGELRDALAADPEQR